ncbi:UvrD-like helicase C-terminal domain-containing protein [Butyrivibrio proteoclasticus]|uniref:UvrD-like helicase C-terminal domain-containing protein n=1 Tax=Butyrivibrio proteoclasticus TaxID=43305 RepID=A0A1I5SLY1_9FIRM|nr:ATP-dependent RecD-like DNA helicase [Butyrivibrio proteoclasticus]SFP71346.1 UvrD-like helicase C-terminal domain-containing protein [Butyrivibrio proteoclasticus]
MDLTQREQIEKYINDVKKNISTHCQREEEDIAAVNSLEYNIAQGGRIFPAFSSCDKWPNHDGTFELVPNPDVSRRPEQVFMVQIKGTSNYREDDGKIRYILNSLAFPAFIADEVTSDPGILFIVLDPLEHGKERFFWKHISPSFIGEIDFSKGSKTIYLSKEDEIQCSPEGIESFCKKLVQIAENHLFIKKLDTQLISKDEAEEIVRVRCHEISKCIMEEGNDSERRDDLSRKIVNQLNDLCYAALILEAIKYSKTCVSEQYAWDIAQFFPETRGLYNFLKGLKYIGKRIPPKGQAERLMLKYHSYLWEIRKLMKKDFGLVVLSNLEDFPWNTDKVDSEYYTAVSSCIEQTDMASKAVRSSRYYIQKKTPFFVGTERYFEITLQLAGIYATKYNRITVYSKFDINTNYSIQIAYNEEKLPLWGITTKIKVLNNCKISIAPTCLNKIAKIINYSTRINRNYGEYEALMNYLTATKINLLEIINLDDENFENVYSGIYSLTKTHEFGDVLRKLRHDYSYRANPEKVGKYTIRFALLNMKEEVLEKIIPKNGYYPFASEPNFSIKCKPFELNPLVSNLVGIKSRSNNAVEISEVVNDIEKVKLAEPYARIEKLIDETGELYFDVDKVASVEDIVRYNNSLDSWEKGHGYSILFNDNAVVIDSYERTTINILYRLMSMSIKADSKERKRKNEEYIDSIVENISDENKKIALKYAFVNSQVMLIYGAAGTGKTTLLKYISDMMEESSQVFLAKTHTALHNLERRINKTSVQYLTIDSVAKGSSILNFDVVFIDECSTIDNRTMEQVLSKIPLNKRIVMSGDIYQIESIDFGNWFYYAKDVIKTKGANVELFNNWRTNNPALRSLWDEVREKKPIISEKLAMDGPFSEDLGENIFIPADEDEVVLCLNYDGKFGLNNMNRYFQNANTSSAEYTWSDWVFKIGDRILFVDTRRFNLLYNNLKGTIVNIEIEPGRTKIFFTIDVYAVFTKEQCEIDEIEYIDSGANYTRIRIDIIAWDDDLEDDEKKKTVIPFQIAYAISIHKAQGLEYNSVKVIIPSSNAEKITHSIFYTAITRAKEKLKIYWSSETMEAIVKSFTEIQSEQKTLPIIEAKLGIGNPTVTT